MKYLICGDVHWSSYSSIVRARGNEFSLRLENLIQTINWVEKTAVEKGCFGVIYLGDFFDKSDLSSEEITALEKIQWNNLYHWVLVGNHEMGLSSLKYSSAHLFGQCPNFNVIDKPYHVVVHEDVQLCFLPYILENDRKQLQEYFPPHDRSIIFSHNDIKGIQMGKFISTEGFDIEDIQTSCRLFLNGHLHNASCIGKNIVNVGNVTGQNFSEDALLYRHSVVLLDAEEDCIAVDWIENPYALNFYRLDMLTYREKIDDDKAYSLLSSIGPNAIVTLKTTPDEKIFYEDMLSNLNNILCYRLIYDSSFDSSTSDSASSQDIELSTLDHLERFEEFVKDNIGEDAIVMEELSKVVCK